MLQKIIVSLTCNVPGKIKGHAGTELHALFFKVVDSINAEMAVKLHEYDVKPFVVGPLVGKVNRKEGYSSVMEGEKYSFSISSLNKEVCALLPAINDYFAKNEVYLGETQYKFLEARYLYKKEQSYFKLMSRSLQEKLIMEFLSPTCFRSEGHLRVFPSPDFVFGGLLERWRRFSDTPLPVVSFNTVHVSKYDLKTNTVNFGKYNLIGFRGRCEYSYLPDSEEIQRWALHTLSNYATIAGVGYKTTMGMGQVRLK